METFNEEKFLVDIEAKRQGLMKKLRVAKILSSFVMLPLVIISIVLLFIFIGNEDLKNSAIYLFIGVMVLCLGVFVVTKILNAKLKKSAYLHMVEVFGGLNHIIFSEEDGFSAIEFEAEGSLTKEDMVSSGLYKDLHASYGRLFNRGKYQGLDFITSETRGDITEVEGKRRKSKTIFLGRIIEVSKKSKEEFVVRLVNDESKIIPPNNLDAYEISVTPRDRITIYSKEPVTVSEYILNLLSAFKENRLVLDLSLCVSKENVFVFINYDDEVFAEHGITHVVNLELMKKLKADIIDSLDLVKAL
ncbi:MAG: hypothetical protein LBR37_00155 [Erysipelotrichaceae bacterium]|jgi:hypothetical protein|nr:hypothetical protein [Erysipelotrichaceae bacterium]